jgi:hypothetical protein
MIDQLILSINPNGSLFNLTMIFDLANTSLFYTLSYVWRNPILFFFSNFEPLIFLIFDFFILNNKKFTLDLDSDICCICKS